MLTYARARFPQMLRAPRAPVTPQAVQVCHTPNDDILILEQSVPRPAVTRGAILAARHVWAPHMQLHVAPQLDDHVAFEQSWPRPRTFVGATWIGAPRLIWDLNHNGQHFTFRLPLSNLFATRSPTSTDDRTAGYTPGSIWAGPTVGAWMMLINDAGGAYWGQFMTGAT